MGPERNRSFFQPLLSLGWLACWMDGSVIQMCEMNVCATTRN